MWPFLHDKFCSFWIWFFVCLLFFFLYYIFSFVEYDIVSGALICLPLKADGLSSLLAFGIVRLLKSSLGIKQTSIFSFCWELAFSPIFTVCTILSANPFDWRWYDSVLYGLYPIFSNHKLKSSSQNSGAWPDTRVFGMPFMKNLTLGISFIVELFLSSTWITSGSTSLGHECKVVYVKFLNSLHFLHFLKIFFVIPWISRPPCFEFFLWVCVTATPQCISSCTLFITKILCISGGIIRSPLQITPCFIVNSSYFFLWSFHPGTISPFDVIQHSTGSYLVSAAILPKDKTSLSTQCKNVSSNSSFVLSFDSL